VSFLLFGLVLRQCTKCTNALHARGGDCDTRICKDECGCDFCVRPATQLSVLCDCVKQGHLEWEISAVFIRRALFIYM
jgi:hypothetical protein